MLGYKDCPPHPSDELTDEERAKWRRPPPRPEPNKYGTGGSEARQDYFWVTIPTEGEPL